MKTKKSEILTVVLFCGFLGAMLLGYLLLPKETYSEKEKRYLTEAPALDWEDIASGQWGEDAESYMADHIPGRDFFVGLNAYFELLTGRQASKDIWVTEDGQLVEAPVALDEAKAAKNMAAIHAFAETLGREVNLILVPSAGWAGEDGRYADDAIIGEIYAQAEDSVKPVDMCAAFAGKPELYYRTDHHWNAEGAYTGYRTLMTALDRKYAPEETFERATYAKFQGSTYSRSCLWLTDAEEFEIWTGSENLTVSNGESDEVHQGVIYWERLEEGDKYTAFLDGNHSIVRIQNPEQDGKILVIRDSYSNSLGCFLAESYGEVVLVDLRYYKNPVSELCAQESFDDIVICYCIGNFMTDENLIWLR